MDAQIILTANRLLMILGQLREIWDVEFVEILWFIEKANGVLSMDAITIQDVDIQRSIFLKK